MKKWSYLKHLPHEQVKYIAITAQKRIEDNKNGIQKMRERILIDKELLSAIEKYVGYAAPLGNKLKLRFAKTYTYKDKILFVFNNANELGIDYVRTSTEVAEAISKLDGRGIRKLDGVKNKFAGLVSDGTIEKVDCPVNGKYYRLVELNKNTND